MFKKVSGGDGNVIVIRKLLKNVPKTVVTIILMNLPQIMENSKKGVYVFAMVDPVQDGINRRLIAHVSQSNRTIARHAALVLQKTLQNGGGMIDG